MLPLAAPACTRGRLRDLAAAFRAQRGRARVATLQPAEAPEGRRMRIRLVRHGPARHDGDALGGRLAALAGRPDGITVVPLRLVLHELTDEAAALDLEEDGGRLRLA